MNLVNVYQVIKHDHYCDTITQIADAIYYDGHFRCVDALDAYSHLIGATMPHTETFQYYDLVKYDTDKDGYVQNTADCEAQTWLSNKRIDKIVSLFWDHLKERINDARTSQMFQVSNDPNMDELLSKLQPIDDRVEGTTFRSVLRKQLKKRKEACRELRFQAADTTTSLVVDVNTQTALTASGIKIALPAKIDLVLFIEKDFILYRDLRKKSTFIKIDM